MNRLNPFLAALSVSLFAIVGFADGGFEDDFSTTKKEGRKAIRGEWTFENNTASCVSDPELYKKFNDHGPIIRWPVTMKDGAAEFEFKATDCQRMVITFNDKGHVFRIVLMDGKNEKAKSRVLGWSGSSKESKPENLTKSVLPTFANAGGDWVKVKLIFKGETAEVSIGEFSETITHASAARGKGEFTIGFAGGELAIRGVKVAGTSSAPTAQ